MQKATFTCSREILQFDYENRRSKNPRFSKRSYARILGISSGRLIDILGGRSPISAKKAAAIVSKLSLEPQDKELFLVLVENENQTRQDGRRKIKRPDGKRLNLDEFALISDWEYFPFMSLIECSNFKSDFEWISKKLGITLLRTKEIIHNLEKLGHIQISADGTITNTHRSLSTLTDIPSSVLRKANTDCILQSLEKMESVDVQFRDITSFTIPVDLEKMKQAKTLIRDFKQQMLTLLGEQNTTEIYNLNIQLVPVSQLGV